MKVLITGVNGFIGKCLADYLYKKGIFVHGIGLQKASIGYTHKYYQIDVRRSFYINEEYDYVIHLAGISRTNVNVNYDFKAIKENNIDGIKNTIHSCKFNKFIFVSTSLIYKTDSKYIDENSKLTRDTMYKNSKYIAEKILREKVDANHYIILRPVNIIGPTQKNVALVPVVFEQAVNNKLIDIFVPYNKNMQFLHVNDFCRLIELILFSDISGIYNVASKEVIEIGRLVEEIVEITKSKSVILNSERKSIELNSIIIGEKIKKELNWSENISISEMLMEFYNKKYRI
ncbi:NAD(P)-dependent oxidoreductase [Blautia pseudococcoides]|uniref:NAD-dependent epimerase/dehydratase family protein n=1 Tax=Blautia pseudococcoides TaxID=1796616 RepID=UPI00148AE7E9|nr:NAD(P)-dependent oxidoreductase [Blautia pseudococcoides]QJU15977.1 NAD(P)-dependent oxidoreductase [Blautia pseudococcoides]